MAAAAMLILAGTEARADLGRVVNALQIARELDEAGDDATIIFDGAGTQWVPALSDEGHKYHRLYEQTKHQVAGACSYCAGVYGVKEAIEGAEVELLDEFEGHPSVRKLISDGYQILTF
ncbi:MAG: DsrE family protein [Actinobacteria bacterium]|nr:DsrE family protein [Actinomycetota bacterium]